MDPTPPLPEAPSESLTDRLNQLKSLDSEAIQSKIAAAKRDEAEKKALEEARMAARDKAIAEYTAAGKAAFAAGNYAEAERQFDRLLECQPDKPAEVVCNRAACALKLGRFADAVSDAAEATYLDDTYVKAYYRLALGHQGMGNVEKAFKACRAGLKLEPDSMQLLKLQEELQKAETEQPGAVLG